MRTKVEVAERILVNNSVFFSTNTFLNFALFLKSELFLAKSFIDFFVSNEIIVNGLNFIRLMLPIQLKSKKVGR